jgi:hypothetical protein
MDKTEMTNIVIEMIDRYTPNRYDLVNYIKEDQDSLKYVLSEIDKNKNEEYSEDDLAVLKEIAYYFL